MAGGVELRYARAFAEVATASRLEPSAALAQLQDFADTLAESALLREVLENPSITMPQKLNVLDALVARLGISHPVRNFIAVILEHHRLAEFDQIREQYRELSDTEAGAIEAIIISARPLAPEARAELEAQVARLAGAQVRATYAEDPDLLGGAVVQIGSTVYDGSLRAQFGQLKQRLANA